MKLKYVIGILTLLVIMVGTVSAEEQTVTLTEDNSNVNRDDPGTLPDGIINVKVTYNPGTGIITYTDLSPTGGSGPYLVNPRIDEVAYNLDRDGTVTSGGNWNLLNGASMDGFGSFTKKLVQDPRNDRYRVVTVKLAGSTPYPTFASGNVVAVHLAFEEAYDADGNMIMESGAVNLGSTFLAGGVNQIPEFATIATPLAAIIGILFIFGRRKNE